MEENLTNVNEKPIKNPERSLFCDREIERAEKRTRGSLFSLVFVALNILSLPIIWVVVTNLTSVVSIDDIIVGFNYNYLYLIIGLLLIVFLLRAFNDFILLYNKTKQRRFVSVFNAGVKNHYNKLTNFYYRNMSVYIYSLNQIGVDKKCATEVAYGKNILEKIANLIYAIVVFLLGCIIAFDDSKTWLIVIGFVGILISSIIVLFVLFFDNNKEKCLVLIGKLSKFLFKLKIVKDYEKFYLDCVGKLIAFKICLKTNKIILITNIICNIIIKFIRHFIIFAIICMINFVDYGLLLDILFRATVIDLVVDMLPLSKGSMVDTMLFVVMYLHTFFEGYVLWGMLIYKLVDYYFLIGLYYIIKLIDRIKECNSGRKKIN